MKLHVYAENFRSYPLIDWTMPNGLTLVDGKNQDTGGSNMAGKTTLLDAWFWCRYGWLPKWRGPKGGSADSILRRKNNVVVGSTLVRVTEQFGPDTIIIERRRPNRLRVWKNSVERPDVDQKTLESFLGMSAERFLVCVYLPQRRQRSFYWMGDSDRMELLSIVAGLDDLDRAAQEAKMLRDEAETVIERAQSKIDLLDSQLKDLPERLLELDSRSQEAANRLRIASQTYFEADMRLDEFNHDYKDKAKEEYEPLVDPIEEQTLQTESEIRSLEHEALSLGKSLDSLPKVDPSFLSAVEKAKKALSEAQSILQKKATMEVEVSRRLALAGESADGMCGECNQLLPEEIRTENSVRHWEAVDQMRAEIAKINCHDLGMLQDVLDEAERKFHAKVAEVNHAPAHLKIQLNAILAQLDSKKKERSMTKDRASQIKNTVLLKWETQKKDLSYALERARQEEKNAKERVDVAQEALSHASRQDVRLRKDLLESENEIKAKRFDLEQAIDLVEVFGPKGYRSVSFDGLIEKISDRAGQLLAVMTDNLYSTRLEQIGQDSKGNQKIILKPIIIKGGSEVPQDDLSGGAEERVALAYDVAVSDAAGEGLPLLLDEVLGALDAVGKSEAMVLLEEVSKTRPVLVIDHASEFKAMFSQVVNIIYENEESRLDTA